MKDVYIEVGLQDGITRMREYTAESSVGGTRHRIQQQHLELPEICMEELSQYLGDGNAKVVVGAELAHSKDFGCKAKSFVTVSVTCNSDSETVQTVHDILMPMVKELAKQDLAEIAEARDEFIGYYEGQREPRVANPQPQQVAQRSNMPPFRR